MKYLKCYIIAEIGVNHNGDIKLAKKLVDEAKKSGADAVKFQLFSADKLVSKDAPKVKYQEKTTNHNESHYEMIKALELTSEEHLNIISYCEKKNIDYISTPYDVNSAKFLIKNGINTIKTASADIVDIELHNYLCNTNCHIIISTGMATLGEIETIVNLYKQNKNNITLLHCVSNYPCKTENLNLKAIQTLKKAFNVNIGYSDHAIGVYPAVASIALGATIIEKHFTLDRKMDGPDHNASSTPHEFKELVTAIRIAESSLGEGTKIVHDEELQMRRISRKSIYIKEEIKCGQQITKENLILKRPGDGLYSYMIPKIEGTLATRDLAKDTKVKYGDFTEA